MTEHTGLVKNFVKIALSHTLFQIKAFLSFTQKFTMTAKNGRKMIFGKKWQMTLCIPCRPKIFIEISLSRTVSEILKIFHFHC